jgi:hypothetical protein
MLMQKFFIIISPRYRKRTFHNCYMLHYITMVSYAFDRKHVLRYTHLYPREMKWNKNGMG